MKTKFQAHKLRKFLLTPKQPSDQSNRNMIKAIKGPERNHGQGCKRYSIIMLFPNSNFEDYLLDFYKCFFYKVEGQT